MQSRELGTSNWVVAQNFFTRIELTENFFPVILASKSKLKPPKCNPTKKVTELPVIFYSDTIRKSYIVESHRNYFYPGFGNSID